MENIINGYSKELNFSSLEKLVNQVFLHKDKYSKNTSLATYAKRKLDNLVKPVNSLGYLEDIVIHLAKWQSSGPSCNKPLLAIFAANHGVNNNNVSAFPSFVTDRVVQAIRDKNAAINQIAKGQNIGLKLYELDLANPSKDFTKAKALTEEQVCRSIYYGMTCCEDGVDILCLGEVGIANTCVASAISCYLIGGNVIDFVGLGAGANKDVLSNKIRAIEKGLALHKKTKLQSPLSTLEFFGGSEIAAMVGAIIAARFARSVVIIDGFTSSVAALLLYEINSDLISHCLFSHLSREKGHRILLDRINKKPYLDLNLALGEGSGSCLLLSLIKATLRCYNDMSKIEEYL